MATNLRNLVHNEELINLVEEEHGSRIELFGLYEEYYMKWMPAIKGYSGLAEETFAWMNELLVECRDTFKTPEVHLIPKTPSVKERKRRGRQARTESEDSESIPQKKTRNARQKGKGDSGVGSIADEDEVEEQKTGSGRATRQTRTSAKSTRSQRSTRAKKTALAEEEEEMEEEETVQPPTVKLKFAIPEADLEPQVMKDAKQEEATLRSAEAEDEPQESKDNTPAATDSDVPDAAVSTYPSDVEMASSSDENHVMLEAPSEDDEEVAEHMADSPDVRQLDLSATKQALRLSSSNSKRASLQKQVQRLSAINKSKSRQRSSMFRHQLRKSMQMAAKIAMEEAEEAVEAETKAEDEIVPASPVPVKRVTRSKMRPPKPGAATDSDSCFSSKKSSAEEGDDEEERKVMPPPPRPARSKLRAKPNHEVITTSSEDEVEPPVRPIRSTRSKMRSQTDTSDSHSSPSTPGRQNREYAGSSLVRSPRFKSPGSEASSADREYVKRFGKPVIVNSPANPFKKKVVPTSNLNSIVNDFLNRNTPKKKPTAKDLAESKKQEIREKEKEAAERLRRQQEDQKRKADEIKRQREERRRLVAQRREERSQLSQQAKAEENRATSKLMDLKQKEEREKQKLREKRQAEVEQRRKQEEELRLRKLHEQEVEQRRREEMLHRQKEQEELERQRRLAEQRRAEETRRLEQERQRKEETERLRKEQLKRRQEEEQQRRLREERDRREKEERERQEIERQKERERQKMIQIEKEKELERQRMREVLEKERLQKEEERRAAELLKKHNGVLQNSSMMNNKLNTTINKDEPSLPSHSTPSIHDVHPNLPKPHDVLKLHYTNYNINTLNSDDSTDDESRPKKKIPKWAEGSELRIALVNQRFHPPDLDELFRDCLEDLDLSKVFSRVKPRFKHRTSSAIWNSPPLKPSGKYFT